MKQLQAKPFLFWWALSVLAGLSTWAIADRRPAVVVAMEKERECSLQIAHLDAQRYEAEKREARLRGALRHMQTTMLRLHGTGWPHTAPIQDNPMLSDLYSTAQAALADQPPQQAALAK